MHPAFQHVPPEIRQRAWAIFNETERPTGGGARRLTPEQQHAYNAECFSCCPVGAVILALGGTDPLPSANRACGFFAARHLGGNYTHLSTFMRRFDLQATDWTDEVIREQMGAA